MTKFGSIKMGVHRLSPTKFKLFNISSLTNETFRIDKYKGEMKYDRIWVYHNEGYRIGSPQRGCQN